MLTSSPTLGLFTDLYQLTMGYGYFRTNQHEKNVVFNYFYRKNPFNGSFCVAAGLGTFLEYLKHFSFSEEDLRYLSTLEGNDQRPLFNDEYLHYLKHLKFTTTVDAVPEGTIVYPHEPIVRIQGPMIQCQLIESALLNIMNFQTLIATKAARMNIAAEGQQVIEFGLRRAQGMDGALSATRAAFIGGCTGTSNALAAKILNIPVKGTHAHSWVMSFSSEEEAFDSYAGVMPNNCIFLVDTYDTIEGVKKAIQAANRLREKGHQLAGIRLDSGDLASLSMKAREMLDEAGFEDAIIVASNDLDEYRIADLKKRGARIDVWGVGTRLVTAFDEPALGGVYKIGAVEETANQWTDKLKISEEKVKISNPGFLQIARFTQNGKWLFDVLDDQRNPEAIESYIDLETEKETVIPSIAHNNIQHSDIQIERLLKPVFVQGKDVRPLLDLQSIQLYVQNQLAQLPSEMKKIGLAPAANNSVKLSKYLFRKREALISEIHLSKAISRMKESLLTTAPALDQQITFNN